MLLFRSQRPKEDTLYTTGECGAMPRSARPVAASPTPPPGGPLRQLWLWPPHQIPAPLIRRGPVSPFEQARPLAPAPIPRGTRGPRSGQPSPRTPWPSAVAAAMLEAEAAAGRGGGGDAGFGGGLGSGDGCGSDSQSERSTPPVSATVLPPRPPGELNGRAAEQAGLACRRPGKSNRFRTGR